MSLLLYIINFEVITANCSCYNKNTSTCSESVKFERPYLTENIKDSLMYYIVYCVSKFCKHNLKKYSTLVFYVHHHPLECLRDNHPYFLFEKLFAHINSLF